MSKRLTGLLIILAVTGSLTGCTIFNSIPEMTRQSVRMFKPRPFDYRDTTEEDQDEWSYVGTEARGDRPLEHDPDPWFKRLFMSGKARSIERNLGYD